MKKLIVMLALAGALMAEGFVVGGEVTYGNVDSEVTATGALGTAGYNIDTKSIGFAIKGGYEFDAVRVLGVITSEKYKDDIIVVGEGNAVAIGAEVDYIIENLFVGGMLASGSKDFSGVDIDFTDVGVRAGGIFNIGEDANIEAGVQFKKRNYDSYLYQGVTIGLDEKIVGIFVGVSFNL